ncbi:kinase-like domain-containing protein, partial [Fomitopsis serialis]|uniref:kinase-like domain-containing protein n=1 Tax=Fomitopsis serialis TaxID=139415 RepID=UPI002007DBCC
TLSATNWDVIQKLVGTILGGKQTSWGRTTSGSFNLVRFLHVEDQPDVVVRVPLNHVETPENAVRDVVATMQYFHEKTKVPIPRIISYSSSADEVSRPYVVTTEAQGVALSGIWDNMLDHRRDMILHQVVELLLEMYSHRFDKIGALSREGDAGAWVIRASQGSEQQSRVYTSGTDYWIDHATRRLANIVDEANGDSAIYEYAHVWWMRSLVPALYDNALDEDGFPLMHGDFHSQNIFVVDAETDNPRISSVIDWDNTGTICTSSFSQPPFFLVDHPLADPDGEKTQAAAKRNARDREVFARLLREEELRRFPNRPPRLSKAHESWEGVYLFEQCVDGGVMYSALWDHFVEHIVGDKAAHQEYIFGLIEKGVLKSVAERM